METEARAPCLQLGKARTQAALSPPGNKGTFVNGAVIATARQLRPGGAGPAARLSYLIRMGNHYSHRETP
ncbi:hypothetical protein [Cupriavidus sp. SK-4]|uniref:hypothetical protein n=1 Tax=Cupriavidus sp. SK-4 TaxID=574750 RepID=UPI00126825B1|nr:hypothetical protein [Cupriavidus sp. SK-4]